MIANVKSRWDGGDLIFYTVAGVDIMKIDDAGKITILTTGALEVAVGATVSGIVAAEAATTTTPGSVELATNAETQTGTDTTRAVTPAGLASLTGTETRDGLLELATDAEAKVATDTARAITPANLAAVLINCKLISFDGRNGAGACTATGAAVGDRVIGVVGLTGGALGAVDASFESTITVINQIQQSSASDLSSNDYLVILLPVS